MTNQLATKHYKVFVGGLSHNVDHSMLRNAFRRFGDVQEATVVKEKHTGVNKGYGFLTFRSQGSYNRALEEEVFIDGLRADVQQLKSKEKLQKMKNLDQHLKVFAGGLHHSVTSNQLKKFFQKHGEILEARVLYDGKTRLSRGFGFVLFRKEEELLRALSARNVLKGKEIDCKRFEQSSIGKLKNNEEKREKSANSKSLDKICTDASSNSQNSNTFQAIAPVIELTSNCRPVPGLEKCLGQIQGHVFNQIGRLRLIFGLNLDYPSESY